MKKAVEELDKCRTTLKWTYAMAYYLAKGNQKDLFEDNQRYVRPSSRLDRGVLM
jgi:ariadne-1